ncbi:phage integrase family protein [Clostridium sporogenes]|uniref:tyrosine-type recombinase/integrase n=1 Tax=Clostridium botulinum TaxID=1491 RepID=UPI0007176774|nr:tyrosine-type recombinase/integrase [Clostridium botulinum]KRU24415.1 phage integrase family protein [Clostridium sporogenes]KRU25667.1 phage integrase family protein [Clostridium sporogenes]KRU30712.1 phage integrase family protein [Clostridium sporogenes]KRU50188.1 phage integrase family protein [Clostridium sporogenes]MBZ1331178.1 tyrosine-type recombinase/integrase [Clostridium botulinum]
MLEVFKDYIIKEGKSNNTVKTYVRHIQGYINWFKYTTGEGINKLYRTNILEYKSYLKNIKKDSAKTINNKLSALVKLNECLIEEGIQTDIVITKKDFIKVQTQVASLATIDKKDVEAFRQKVLENEGLRNYSIVTIISYAGLRISEVLNLKLDDIDLTSKELIVKEGKGDKERIVYINSKIVEAVKEYLKVRKEDSTNYLFISNKGGKIDRTVINKVFKKYSDKITPHTLRHFYCSNALESGFSVHEVANQAGHSNIHTTLLYTNPSKEKMKNKAELL